MLSSFFQPSGGFGRARFTRGLVAVALVATSPWLTIDDGLGRPRLAMAQNAAQAEAAALPDSALEALQGRQVRFELASGLEAEGELVAFDADSVTLMRADGRLMVLERGDVASMGVGAAATPPEEPSEDASPSDATAADLLATEAPAEQAEEEPGDPPVSETAVVSNPDRDKGLRMLIAGGAVGGGGLILSIAGGVVLSNVPRELECRSDGCFTETPGDKVIPAAGLLFLGTGSLIAAAIVVPIGASKFFGADDGEDVVELRLGPGSVTARWQF